MVLKFLDFGSLRLDFLTVKLLTAGANLYDAIRHISSNAFQKCWSLGELESGLTKEGWFASRQSSMAVEHETSGRIP